MWLIHLLKYKPTNITEAVHLVQNCMVTWCKSPVLAWQVVTSIADGSRENWPAEPVAFAQRVAVAVFAWSDLYECVWKWGYNQLIPKDLKKKKKSGSWSSTMKETLGLPDFQRHPYVCDSGHWCHDRKKDLRRWFWMILPNIWTRDYHDLLAMLWNICLLWVSSR